VKVEPATGTLILREPELGILAMKAGPGLSLRHVVAGERLYVEYYPEVAVALHARGERGETSRTPHPSPRTAGATAMQPTSTEKVVAVDTIGHTVTLRGPSAQTHVIHLTDPRLQAQLEGVRAGEPLEVTYTEALAVAAKPGD
jgi:hypothetical protein